MNTENLCPFIGKCGGCVYQDLPEQTYLDKKQSFIRRSFADYGLAVNPEPIIQIPLYSRRRACFAFTHGRLGYNALHSHTVAEITECRLLEPAITAFLPTLRDWARQLKTDGDIFVLNTPFGLDIHIKTVKSNQPDLPLLERLADFANRAEVARLSYNGTPIAAKVLLPVMPDDFLQPSHAGEEALVRLVLEQIGSARTAVDLFCGGGTFTKPLLTRGLRVRGYDCSNSVHLLGSNGYVRDLFRSPLLPEELIDIDLAVIDPPRAGALAQVRQLAKSHIPIIVMVSCAPKTAARDCQVLVNAGWHLDKITPVDQFKWSNHIELVCVLKK